MKLFVKNVINTMNISTFTFINVYLVLKSKYLLNTRGCCCKQTFEYKGTHTKKHMKSEKLCSSKNLKI